MNDLIKALTIFMKYKNEAYPTHCEHDILMIMGVGKKEMSQEDTEEVTKLGFHWSSEYDCWASFKFGSA